MDDEEDVDMCFLDFSMASDVVHHRFICVKLIDLGMSLLVLGWIRNYLVNYTCRVHIADIVFKEAKLPSSAFWG